MTVHTIGLMTLGEKIERLCEARNWNRAELARRVGVSKTTAGHWIDGKSKPSGAKLSRLARVLDADINYLMSDDLDEPPGPDLTPEEWAIVDIVRDLGVREARRRLLAVPDGSPIVVERTTPELPGHARPHKGSA